MPIRVSQERFARLVDEAVASLPDSFKPYMENVSVEILPRPTRRMRLDARLGPDDDLLGLYQGVPLTEKSVSTPYDWPERILIFKGNIERICDTEREVIRQVRQTVLHEIGHHFGLSEDDLDELGYA